MARKGCTEAAIVRACHAHNKTDSWRQVARACGVSPHGPVPFGPFASLGARSVTCARLYAKNTARHLLLSIDEQMRAFLSSLTRVEQHKGLETKHRTREAAFRGEILDCLFALIYLLREFPDTCVDVEPLRRELFEHRHDAIHWSHVALYWHFSWTQNRFALHVPGDNASDYLNRVARCLTQPRPAPSGAATPRFFFALLVMGSTVTGPLSLPVLHANVVLFDRVTGILERFDPYEGQLASFRTVELDRALEQLFASLPGFREFVAPPHVSAEARRGLQLQAEQALREEQLEKREQASDPAGFCLPWSVLYAETRLRFPNQDPDSIPQLLRVWSHEQHRSLAAVARDYTRHLERLKLEALQETSRRLLLAPEQSPDALIYRVALELLLREAER